MSKAEQIMKKKQFIKKEMDRQISAELSDKIWKQSTTVLLIPQLNLESSFRRTQ